jgi:hypothetical protein
MIDAALQRGRRCWRGCRCWSRRGLGRRGRTRARRRSRLGRWSWSRSWTRPRRGLGIRQSRAKPSATAQREEKNNTAKNRDDKCCSSHTRSPLGFSAARAAGILSCSLMDRMWFSDRELAPFHPSWRDILASYSVIRPFCGVLGRLYASPPGSAGGLWGI